MNKYLERFEAEKNLLQTQMHAKRRQGLFAIATELVIETQKASISHLQRTFQIGYNEAADLMERLELNNIVSKPVGVNGSRTVLIR